MTTIRNYIIVDDDPFNNILCSMEIENAIGEVQIKIFEVPEDGLVYIQGEFATVLKPTILILDINMPSLSGWQFMEQYENFSEEVRSQIDIYIVSSSVDNSDKEKAKANKHIKGYLSKPLNNETIIAIAQT